jgi:ankyrin repeat protein
MLMASNMCRRVVRILAFAFALTLFLAIMTVLYYATRGDALRDAVDNNDPSEVARILREDGRLADRRFRSHETPLIRAVNYDKHLSLMALLECGANPNIAWEGKKTNISGYTPLHIACQVGRLESVLGLLRHGADSQMIAADGTKPIDHAEKYGHKKIVDVLAKFNNGK